MAQRKFKMNNNEELTLVNNETQPEIDNFAMTQYQSRNGWCPVREIKLTEYQIPLDLIRRMPKSHQPRVQDCSEGAVIEKAEQMKSEKGQTTGICVYANKDDDTFDVYWGNTRFRGGKVLSSRGERIYNCESGYIWASLYEHSLSNLRKYQAAENNSHDVNERATPEDNLNSILQMIREGQIKGYGDLDQEKQREEVKELYLECKMPAHKFRSLWNQVKKRDKVTSRKMRTWDKNELPVYFGAHNDYGITSQQCNATTRSGTVFDVTIEGQAEKLAVYFVSKTSEFGGATLSNTNWNRNIHKHSTKVVVVVSMNDNRGRDINGSRDSIIDKIKKWNPSLVANKSVDRILFVPQTESEQQIQLIAGQYLKHTRF
tara:strand:- start:12294 stop:13412 length:1119 start_codon:yes stop_codon:yes gene_type:complete